VRLQHLAGRHYYGIHTAWTCGSCLSLRSFNSSLSPAGDHRHICSHYHISRCRRSRPGHPRCDSNSFNRADRQTSRKPRWHYPEALALARGPVWVWKHRPGWSAGDRPQHPGGPGVVADGAYCWAPLAAVLCLASRSALAQATRSSMRERMTGTSLPAGLPERRADGP
jgi:hypothetical protein